MQIFKVTISELDAPRALRDYMRRELGFSTSLIARVKYGGIRINGEIVTMRAVLKCGDELTVEFPKESSENIPPIDIPLDIVYEDDYLLAVNKPRNMPVHPSRGNSLPTLANAVMAYLNRPFVFRAVNRLDRDTSGIVLIAKDPLTAALMCRAIKNGGLTKKYVGLVSGVPEIAEGEINAPIEREKDLSIKRIVRADGKPSLTRYRVVGITQDGSSLCELEPVTGRTHQLRVHLSYIGHPLVNDFLYGEGSDNETYKLHCKSLGFLHPVNKKHIEILCKADFENQFCPNINSKI